MNIFPSQLHVFSCYPSTYAIYYPDGLTTEVQLGEDHLSIYRPDGRVLNPLERARGKSICERPRESSIRDWDSNPSPDPTESVERPSSNRLSYGAYYSLNLTPVEKKHLLWHELSILKLLLLLSVKLNTVEKIIPCLGVIIIHFFQHHHISYYWQSPRAQFMVGFSGLPESCYCTCLF